MAFALLQVLGGVLGLYYGAEWFVGGAASLARGLRISPAVVGLTVVSFASSTPELIFTFTAAVQNKAEMGLGNILGSNVANIGLVLGLAALVRVVPVSRAIVRSGLPFLFASFAALYVLALNRTVGRVDGLLLLGVFAGFALAQVRSAIRAKAEMPVEQEPPPLRPVRDGTRVVLGVVAMAVGSEFLVSGAETIALAVGLSQTFIAVTLVALGTSLPELATSVVAAFKGESEIALANVVGSNVLNIALVLALVTVIRPLPVSRELFRLHLPAVLAFSVALLPLLLFGNHVGRAKGGLLMVAYAGYIVLAYGMQTAM